MRASSLRPAGLAVGRPCSALVAAYLVLLVLFLLGVGLFPVAGRAPFAGLSVTLPDTVSQPYLQGEDDSLRLLHDTLGNLQLQAERTIIAQDTTASEVVSDTLSGTKWTRFCDSLATGWVGLSAVLLPGTGQVINRDYWKIPAFYAAIGGFTTGAVLFGRHYEQLIDAPLPLTQEDQLLRSDRIFSTRLVRNTMIAAAIISYGLSVGDAVICHNKTRQSPAAAAFCSALLPGLGQIYNRSYWKVPIVYGGLSILAYYWAWNNLQFHRADRALVAMLDDDPNTIDEFGGKRPKEELQYYSDDYRRSRDLCLFGLIGVYLLNIVDAYVDAHLFYWNVNNDILLSATPTFTFSPLGPSVPIAGLGMNLFF